MVYAVCVRPIGHPPASQPLADVDWAMRGIAGGVCTRASTQPTPPIVFLGPHSTQASVLAIGARSCTSTLTCCLLREVPMQGRKRKSLFTSNTHHRPRKVRPFTPSSRSSCRAGDTTPASHISPLLSPADQWPSQRGDAPISEAVLMLLLWKKGIP